MGIQCCNQQKHQEEIKVIDNTEDDYLFKEKYANPISKWENDLVLKNGPLNGDSIPLQEMPGIKEKMSFIVFNKLKPFSVVNYDGPEVDELLQKLGP